MQRENKKEAALVERPDKDSNKNIIADEMDEICRKLQREADPTYLKCFTMEQLYGQVFESRPSIIEGLLKAGTYIFAGAPKLGKSFLAAQLAWHVSTGKPLWDMPVKQGTVLYLALEDDKRRLQERLFRMFGAEATEKLHLSINSQCIGDGLIKQMEHFIEEYPDTRLIIIDTLQKVRELSKEQYSYAGDYSEIAELKKISDKYSIGILLVHHTRKQQADDGFDMISGTSGLMGAADGAILMREEKRTGDTASLDISGRDQQDQKLYLKRNEATLAWELERMETELWKEPPDPVLEKISSYLNDCGKWSGSPTELVQALGLDMKANTLTMRLNVKAGRLHDEYGIHYSSRRSHAGRRIELRRDDA